MLHSFTKRTFPTILGVARLYSTKLRPIDKELRLTLNSLYKLVHPDFYEGHNEAKTSNDKSFKLLQEYVDFTRQTSLRGRPSEEYLFTFYIWKDALDKRVLTLDDDEESSSSSTSNSQPPREATKVSVKLPPPQRGSAFKNRHAFKKLFEACGLSFDPTPSAASPSLDFDGNAESDSSLREEFHYRSSPSSSSSSSRGRTRDDGGWEDEDRSSEGLSERERNVVNFMDDAAEILAQLMTSERAKSPHIRVPYLRAAVRHARGAMVSFKNPDLVPGSQQVAALERLIQLLEFEFDGEEALDVDLDGQQIVLGDWTGLDPFGHLCLDLERSIGWEDFLLGVDLDFALERRKIIESIRNLELKVAKRIGLWLICAEPREVARDRYRIFLEALVNEAVKRGAIPRIFDVTLTVRAPEAAPADWSSGNDNRHRSGGSNCCWTEMDERYKRGCVATTSLADPKSVYDWLVCNADTVAAETKAKTDSNVQLKELIDKTRKELGLRYLTHSKNLSESQIRLACQALLRVSGPARFRVEGSSIRIGFQNVVRKEDFEMEIAWDALL